MFAECDDSSVQPAKHMSDLLLYFDGRYMNVLFFSLSFSF